MIHLLLNLSLAGDRATMFPDIKRLLLFHAIRRVARRVENCIRAAAPFPVKVNPEIKTWNKSVLDSA